MKHGEARINQRHPLRTQDAVVISELRAASAEHKGDLIGPEIRVNPDAELAAAPPAPEGVQYQRDSVAGVPGWWCLPADALLGARLLYLHGGGYVAGSATAARHVVAQLALLTRSESFVPDYRQAPENPFPAAVKDAVAVYDALAATAEKIVASGESAGGGLLLSLMAILAERNDSQRQFVGAAAFSPWADLTLKGETHLSRAEADPFVTREVLQHFADLYLQGAEPTDPTASPLYAPAPRNGPPLRIDVGDLEILLDDSVRYAKKFADAGLCVSLHIWEGMPHGFQAIGSLGAADAVVKEVGEFLQSCLLRTHVPE